MTSRPPAVKTEHHKAKRDFTLRPDEKTWKRFTKYCRTVEDETGYLPSKNSIILEALNEWLDRQTKKPK